MIFFFVGLVVAIAASPPIEAPRATRDALYIVTCSIARYCLWSDGKWTPPLPGRAPIRDRSGSTSPR